MKDCCLGCPAFPNLGKEDRKEGGGGKKLTKSLAILEPTADTASGRKSSAEPVLLLMSQERGRWVGRQPNGLGLHSQTLRFHVAYSSQPYLPAAARSQPDSSSAGLAYRVFCCYCFVSPTQCFNIKVVKFHILKIYRFLCSPKNLKALTGVTQHSPYAAVTNWSRGL